MKRLTERRKNGAINVRYATEHETAIHRLAAIEDILGDEYDLDRLRELAEADREGRCVVLLRLEPEQGDDPGPPGVPGPPGEVVFCKDGDYLEYSEGQKKKPKPHLRPIATKLRLNCDITQVEGVKHER